MTLDPRHISIHPRVEALVIEVICRRLNDHEQVAELRDEILMAMQQLQSLHVILDLRNVQLLTSVALFPFIDIRSAAEREGRRVVLCNVATPVAQVLTVSQLIVENRDCAHHLVLTEDIPAAIDWFSQGDSASGHANRRTDSFAQPACLMEELS